MTYPEPSFYEHRKVSDRVFLRKFCLFLIIVGVAYLLRNLL